MKPSTCGNCRERAVVPVTTSYTAEMEHDGRSYTVTVPDLEILECERCKTRRLSDEAYERLRIALREKAGLLTPGQIRSGREALGMTQEQLAVQLGVAEATLSRWETGGQLQQRSLDRFLRLVFGLPEARAFLADDARLANLPIAG